MGRAVGFVGLLIALAIGAYIYTQQTKSASVGGSTPRATIDTVGVRNDLMAIANAERRRFATDGKYVSLGELRSNGDISMQKDSRGPYTYSVETSADGFRVTATYSGDDSSAIKVMSVDQNMQVRNE